jgi:hypothetical protein
MSSIILHAQPIIVKSTLLPTQTSNANSIEVKSIRQKRLHDVVDASPPRNNVRGCGQKLFDVVDISPPRRNATIRDVWQPLLERNKTLLPIRRGKKQVMIISMQHLN